MIYTLIDADNIVIGKENLPEGVTPAGNYVEGVLGEIGQLWNGENFEEYTPIPQTLTMRQAKLALLRTLITVDEAETNLLTVVDAAVDATSDKEMKIEWEYAEVVRRDWVSLNVMAESLGLTQDDLDHLFILGETL